MKVILHFQAETLNSTQAPRHHKPIEGGCGEVHSRDLVKLQLAAEMFKQLEHLGAEGESFWASQHSGKKSFCYFFNVSIVRGVLKGHSTQSWTHFTKLAHAAPMLQALC